MRYTVFETAIGWMGLTGSEAGLRLLVLPSSSCRETTRTVSIAGAVADADFFADLERRLRLYLSGSLDTFDDVTLDLTGATDFRLRVWRETRSIPYGETRSYMWLAQRAGSPGACRAAGNAMAANPVPIIIPCHRVITSSGKLGGFGGGKDLKRYLIDMEREAVRQVADSQRR